MAFAKIHDRILSSSIMEEDIHVRYVWHCLLIIADRDGFIDGTPIALARRFNVPVEQFDDAMRVLTSPDQYSRSHDEDGRRIVEIGPQRWRVVNHDHYRRLGSTEDAAEKHRERQRRYKARKVNKSLAGDASVTVGDGADAIAETETETETETEAESRTTTRTRFVPPTVDEVYTYLAEKGYTFDAEAFVAYYTANGWKVGRSPMKDWHAACVTWQKREVPKKQHVGATPTEHPYHPDDVREYQTHERWDEYLDMCLELPRDRWPAPRFTTWMEGHDGR